MKQFILIIALWTVVNSISLKNDYVQSYTHKKKNNLLMEHHDQLDLSTENTGLDTSEKELFNKATAPKIIESYCGCSKTTESNDSPAALTDVWRKEVLTYSFINFSLKMPWNKQRDLMRKAFDIWSEHIQLDFVETWKDSNADIRISFQRLRHLTCEKAFDGPSNVVAHAFSPGYSAISGDIHFDADENWSSKTEPRSVNFFITAAHEIGHSLGLRDSWNREALMYGLYQEHNLDEFRLPEPDVNEIVRLYPRRSRSSKATEERTKTTTPITTTTTTTTTESVPELCNLYSYDSVSYIRGDLFIFKGIYYWKKLRDASFFKGPYMVTEFFRGFTGQVTAAFEDSSRNRIKLFNGDTVSEFRFSRLVKGPTKVSNFGLNSEVQAAAYLEETDESTVYDGKIFWKKQSQDQYFAKIFYNAPQRIDSMFTRPLRRHNKLYFVINKEYYEHDLKQKTTFGPYPFDKHFLGCY